MLFNHPEFISYVANHFVGVAADDVAYNHLPAEQKGKREFQFLRAALTDGNRQIHQGVYAITSSGKFLGKIDTGWPTYDPIKSLQNLRKAKARYDQMDKRERVAEKAFTEADRSLVKSKTQRPDVGLKIITYARHYPFADMELFDLRHPEYSKRDSLWLSVEEAKGLLPNSLSKGAKGDVAKPVVERLLLHGHLMFGCPAWWREHIQSARMTAEVYKVDGTKVYLKYSGDFDMDADSRWNKSAYKGNLLGKACWDTSRQRFESLEWVSVGRRSLEELKSNLHRGSTKTTSVAAYLRLAGRSAYEQQLLPHKWDEYPRSMKAGN